MRNEIKMTDEQIEDRFDSFGYGATIDDVDFTRDTIEDFVAARKGWHNRGCVSTHSDSELEIENAQAVKGQPRRSVVVIDFGTVRGVLTA